MTGKLCFVVQGFGSKTDFTDGRVLDLDASYDIIKQAVEKAGLRCLRADEIVHSGSVSASALATREARSERLRGLAAELNQKLPSPSAA